MLSPKILQTLVEDALTGNISKWDKVVSENDNGLLFKEWMDKRKKDDL